MKTGFWYLATPYTGYANHMREVADRATDDVLLGLAANRAAQEAAKLLGAGVHVYSPIVHSHVLCKSSNLSFTDHEFWMAVDEPFMQAAIGMIVVKMPGWDASEGIAYERRRFAEMRKPILWLEV